MLRPSHAVLRAATGLSICTLLALLLLPARAQEAPDSSAAQPSFEDLVLCGDDLDLPNFGEPCGQKECSGTMRCDPDKGVCTWSGVEGIPQSAADCSTVCAFYGDCDYQMVEDSCTGRMPVCRPSAAGCAAAELCRSDGRCGFDSTTTACTVTIAGCAASRRCKSDGHCHPAVVSGWGPPGWECNTREASMDGAKSHPTLGNPGDPEFGSNEWLEPYPLGEKRPKAATP